MGKVRVPSNQTTATVSGLTGNSQYFLTVSAFNTAGTGPFLPAINATTKKPRKYPEGGQSHCPPFWGLGSRWHPQFQCRAPIRCDGWTVPGECFCLAATAEFLWALRDLIPERPSIVTLLGFRRHAVFLATSPGNCNKFCSTAPGQPPLNVEWTLIGSLLILHWDAVVTMETESEATGYKVSSC